MQTQAAFHSITQPEIQDPCFAGCCLAYGSANSVSFSVSRELHLSLIPARLDTNEQVTINATCSWPISKSYRRSKAFVLPQQMAMDWFLLPGSIHLHLSGTQRSRSRPAQVTALSPSLSCDFAAQVWTPPIGPVCSLLIVRCVRLPQAPES